MVPRRARRAERQAVTGVVGRIISGGQTGADRAGLDAAIALGVEHGGWIPAGRLTEAGPLDVRYNLRETISLDYRERTRLNVQEADATVIFTRGEPERGSALTFALAYELRKPVLCVDVGLHAGGTAARINGRAAPIERVRDFVFEHGVACLNVAGNRESISPGIGRWVFDCLAVALGPVPGFATYANLKHDGFEIAVDRGSPWGNWNDGPTRAYRVEKHRATLLAQPELVEQHRARLSGRVLGCHCAPLLCHAQNWCDALNLHPDFRR